MKHELNEARFLGMGTESKKQLEKLDDKVRTAEQKFDTAHEARRSHSKLVGPSGKAYEGHKKETRGTYKTLNKSLKKRQAAQDRSDTKEDNSLTKTATKLLDKKGFSKKFKDEDMSGALKERIEKIKKERSVEQETKAKKKKKEVPEPPKPEPPKPEPPKPTEEKPKRSASEIGKRWGIRSKKETESDKPKSETK